MIAKSRGNYIEKYCNPNWVSIVWLCFSFALLLMTEYCERESLRGTEKDGENGSKEEVKDASSGGKSERERMSYELTWQIVMSKQRATL